MRFLRAGVLCLLTACSAAPTTLTPRACLPTVKQSGFWSILFINGDFVPDNGYPHSRVNDDAGGKLAGIYARNLFQWLIQ